MTDETIDAFVVPMTEIEQHLEWTECAAFRFVIDGDEVRLEVTNDLDRITAPEDER